MAPSGGGGDEKAWNQWCRLGGQAEGKRQWGEPYTASSQHPGCFCLLTLHGHPSLLGPQVSSSLRLVALISLHFGFWFLSLGRCFQGSFTSCKLCFTVSMRTSVDGQMNCISHVPVVSIAGVKISSKYLNLCSDPFGCTCRSVANAWCAVVLSLVGRAHRYAFSQWPPSVFCVVLGRGS